MYSCKLFGSYPRDQKHTKDHYIVIIAQLWLTSHPRSTVILLDTGTPGTREVFSEDADGETNSQPLGYKPSALAIELTNSKAIAVKELSLSSWCIASLCIYYFSAVVDFSSKKYGGSTWTQELLIPAETFSVRMPMVRLRTTVLLG